MIVLSSYGRFQAFMSTFLLILLYNQNPELSSNDFKMCTLTTRCVHALKKLAMEWKLFHFNCKKSVRDISGPICMA